MIAHSMALEEAFGAAVRSGPGAAVAVLKDGSAILSQCSGRTWAGGDPITPATRFRVCSITKQFTCALLLDLVDEGRLSLDDALDRWMSGMHDGGPAPTLRQLCANQSGLRDYWAVAMLCGAKADDRFRRPQAEDMILRRCGRHFAPGTAFSYSNTNFALLGWVAERCADRSFADMLKDRVLDRWDLPHAIVEPVISSRLANCATGHEGSKATRVDIAWEGDGGLACSLDDLIRWEQAADRRREDDGGVFSRLIEPQPYGDGGASPYALGLRTTIRDGQRLVFHAGAIRGWRACVVRAPATRTSVIVLYNHEAYAQAAAFRIVDAINGVREQTSSPDPLEFAGSYVDREQSEAVEFVEQDGRVMLVHSHARQQLHATDDGVASADGVTRIVRSDGKLELTRRDERYRLALEPAGACTDHAPVGVYRCETTGSKLFIDDGAGQPTATFKGCLGDGDAAPLVPVSRDMWTIPCERALDAPAPGRWTVRAATADALIVSNWLARTLRFDKIRS